MSLQCDSTAAYSPHLSTLLSGCQSIFKPVAPPIHRRITQSVVTLSNKHLHLEKRERRMRTLCWRMYDALRQKIISPFVMCSCICSTHRVHCTMYTTMSVYGMYCDAHIIFNSLVPVQIENRYGFCVWRTVWYSFLRKLTLNLDSLCAPYGLLLIFLLLLLLLSFSSVLFYSRVCFCCYSSHYFILPFFHLTLLLCVSTEYKI